MRTAILAALIAAPATAQSTPAPFPPEAQAVFDRAIAACKGLKNYQETTVLTVRQRASGLPAKSEPPADQASATRFVWAGPERFAFDTRDIALFRNPQTVTIYVKALGEYTQREPNEQDRRIIRNLIDNNPIYQVLSAGAPGSSIGRLSSATSVQPAQLRETAGKRIAGAGFPPLPGFDAPAPATMFFADDTGLLIQSTWDLKAHMQAQIDRSVQPGAPRITLDQFELISDRTDIRLNQTDAAIDALLTFTPAPADRKVNEFNTADGKDGVQRRLIGAPAPDFAAVTLDGAPIALKDHKGKPVLLQFWTAASRPSADALLLLSVVNGDYASKGVAFIGVNLDHASVAEQSRRLAAARSVNFPQVMDSDKAVANAFRVAATPCTILIDKDGVVRSISAGPHAPSQAELTAKLDALLRGEPISDAPPPPPSHPFTPPGHAAPQPR